LVDIILSNNGYNVVNLGIKQPVSAILEAAEEAPDASGATRDRPEPSRPKTPKHSPKPSDDRKPGPGPSRAPSTPPAAPSPSPSRTPAVPKASQTPLVPLPDPTLTLPGGGALPDPGPLTSNG
ncbi:hypothetical protein ACWC5O_42575, partial [Streptomyces sp. NPDC001450]